MRISGNTILITGGTSGIGRALAEDFHRRGNQVIIAGRREPLLKEITAAHPGMHGMQLDVEDPRAVDAFASSLQKQFPELNVFINNAGISRREDLTADTSDISVARSIIHTNILSDSSSGKRPWRSSNLSLRTCKRNLADPIRRPIPTPCRWETTLPK